MRGSIATHELGRFFIGTCELLNRITEGKLELSVKNVQIPSRTSTISDKKRTTNVIPRDVRRDVRRPGARQRCA